MYEAETALAHLYFTEVYIIARTASLTPKRKEKKPLKYHVPCTVVQLAEHIKITCFQSLEDLRHGSRIKQATTLLFAVVETELHLVSYHNYDTPHL